MKPADSTITEAEQREQYALTGLARLGMSFERAIQSDAIRIALNGAIKGRRRIAARQAREAAIQYQTQEAA